MAKSTIPKTNPQNSCLHPGSLRWLKLVHGNDEGSYANALAVTEVFRKWLGTQILRLGAPGTSLLGTWGTGFRTIHAAAMSGMDASCAPFIAKR